MVISLIYLASQEECFPIMDDILGHEILGRIKTSTEERQLVASRIFTSKSLTNTLGCKSDNKRRSGKHKKMVLDR